MQIAQLFTVQFEDPINTPATMLLTQVTGWSDGKIIDSVREKIGKDLVNNPHAQIVINNEVPGADLLD
jgi:hypothetical protein